MREHKTDGSKCWCKPRVEKVKLVRCIACAGSGRVVKPKQRGITKRQKAQIMKLYKRGHGIRDIARILHITSPYSVQYAIKNANK